MPRWLALGFQDGGSPSICELSYLHDHVITIMIRVTFLIVYIMYYLLRNTKFYKHLSEGTLTETVWSIVPAFLLVVLAVPSIKILYIIEDIKSPTVTFKVIAHQWYWTYVAPLFKNLSFSLKGTEVRSYEFDSVLEPYSLERESPRLLGCSRELFVPVKTTSRFVITSTDVIHSFAVPALGIKVDALPGRINQLFVNPNRVGVFFGQCSEICGSNHSFIPIKVKVCGIEDFDKVSIKYLISKLEEGVGESINISVYKLQLKKYSFVVAKRNSLNATTNNTTTMDFSIHYNLR